jgi:AraC family transcriptional regulator, arabinose operon regulatory protein
MLIHTSILDKRNSKRYSHARSSFLGLITMDRRIELIISKLKKDPTASWDISVLAVLVNLSPSRFRHLFKQETGTSPAQYLKDLRLARAEKMLRTTFLSIKQVLKQVGIASNAHFVRDFRRKYGTTPTAYRRAIRRKQKRKR